MKKAISMRCNIKQFESIKSKLEIAGLEISQLRDFGTSCYLVNNFSGNTNSITNVLPYDMNSYNRKVYQVWNEKIFLEACGIEVEKPIRTNKLTELEKRVEVLEAKVDLKKISDMPKNDALWGDDIKPLLRDKKSSYEAFKEAFEQNKILLPNLYDSIKLSGEFKNYRRPISYGIDFGFVNDRSVIFKGGRNAGKNYFLNEMYKLQSRIEELEAENKAILAGNLIKIQVGKWYVSKKNDFIVFIKELKRIDSKYESDGFYHQIYYYGIVRGAWKHDYFANKDYEKNMLAATESEVFESLKNEAVKRGYKDNMFIKRENFEEFKGDSKTSDKNSFIDWRYWELTNSLECFGTVVFEKGKWAEIQETLKRSEDVNTIW